MPLASPTQSLVYEAARRALASTADSLTLEQVAEANREREATKARFAAAQTPVPERLDGKMFSRRDFSVMPKVSADIDAAFAPRAVQAKKVA